MFVIINIRNLWRSKFSVDPALILIAALGGILKSFPSRMILRLEDFQYSANKAKQRTAVVTTRGTVTLLSCTPKRSPAEGQRQHPYNHHQRLHCWECQYPTAKRTKQECRAKKPEKSSIYWVKQESFTSPINPRNHEHWGGARHGFWPPTESGKLEENISNRTVRGPGSFQDYLSQRLAEGIIYLPRVLCTCKEDGPVARTLVQSQGSTGKSGEHSKLITTSIWQQRSSESVLYQEMCTKAISWHSHLPMPVFHFLNQRWPFPILFA